MKIKKVMLFAYDFPHKKTQDFLFRLIIEGYKIEYCIAAPWKKLNIKPSTVRIEHKHTGLIHPQLICKKFNIKYLSADHESLQTIKFIKQNPVDLYIIAGARIIKPEVIKACNEKVLNIHPGLLPEVRGLDTVLWSIHYKKRLGLSAHFITSKIDSGILIYKEKLPLYRNDTLFDVTLRLLEYQPEILIKSLNILKEKDIKYFENLNQFQTPYNTKMNPKSEKETINHFHIWLRTFSDQ